MRADDIWLFLFMKLPITASIVPTTVAASAPSILFSPNNAHVATIVAITHPENTTF